MPELLSFTSSGSDSCQLFPFLNLILKLRYLVIYYSLSMSNLTVKSSSGSIVPMKYSAGSNVALPSGITVAALTEFGLLFATLSMIPPGFNFGALGKNALDRG